MQLRSASSSRLCSCVDSDIVNRWPSAAAVVTLVRNKKSSGSNELEMAIDRSIGEQSSSLHHHCIASTSSRSDGGGVPVKVVNQQQHPAWLRAGWTRMG